MDPTRARARSPQALTGTACMARPGLEPGTPRFSGTPDQTADCLKALQRPPRRRARRRTVAGYRGRLGWVWDVRISPRPASVSGGTGLSVVCSRSPACCQVSDVKRHYSVARGEDVWLRSRYDTIRSRSECLKPSTTTSCPPRSRRVSRRRRPLVLAAFSA
jgi:hypothetical protein